MTRQRLSGGLNSHGFVQQLGDHPSDAIVAGGIDQLRLVLLECGDEGLVHEAIRRLGEGVGQNRRFHLVHSRMLAILDRWDGDTEGAARHLREAEALAEEIGLPSELWQIGAALGELHEERGEQEKARASFARAGEALEALAGRIRDEELREGFLSAPQVRRVLRER